MSKHYNTQTIRKIVEEQTKHEYSLIAAEEQGFRNPLTGKCQKRKMKIQHNKACGHIYKLDIYEFIEGKRRCPKCKGKVLRKHFATDIKSIKSKTLAITDRQYQFVDTHYTNSKTKHLFKHLTCGTTFRKSWDKFKGTPSQAGQRCPQCQRKGMESMASRYTRDILDYFNVAYSCEKRFADCTNPKTGNVLPFDYYLAKINLIIEIDGEQHERASFTPWDVEGTIYRDGIKNTYAEEKGIELVRIPAKKWSQLPEVLHAILSKNLLKKLTLKEVQSVVQSSHPERISKDLKKIHKGAYSLEDNFYSGSERKHHYKHSACGHVFITSLAYLKDNKHPCPQCRKKSIETANHTRINKHLLKKSKGRYCLSKKTTAIDSVGKRVIHCHRCHTEWSCLVSNLMQDNAGCPQCHKNKQEQRWIDSLTLVLKTLKEGKKLQKKEKQWIYHNKKKYLEHTLKSSREKLLLSTKLIQPCAF